MQETGIDAACELIAAAMNATEAGWARQTFKFHFGCRRHGLDDGRVYFTCHQQAELVAIGGLHHYAWGPAENVWLAWFAVDPQRQRQGIGRWMLNSLESLAFERGFRKFFIETYAHPDFDNARRFYEACGYREAGAINDYLSGGESMLVYTKALK